MPNDRISLPSGCRWMSYCLVAASIAVRFFVSDIAIAKTPPRGLQGLFCNAAKQVDDALTYMRSGVSPKAAVGLVNRGEVVCTYVDLLHYVVERPVIIQEIRGSFPLFKYEGTLVAVIAGGVVRPVTPPAQVYFAIPDRLEDAPLEGGA